MEMKLNFVPYSSIENQMKPPTNPSMTDTHRNKDPRDSLVLEIIPSSITLTFHPKAAIGENHHLQSANSLQLCNNLSSFSFLNEQQKYATCHDHWKN